MNARRGDVITKPIHQERGATGREAREKNRARVQTHGLALV
jgi:hypothetical protein